MQTTTITRRLFWAGEMLLLAATVGAAAVISRPAEWHPLPLVALLLALALASKWFSVKTSSGELTASFIAMVLAMGLLGPVPAALCGVTAAALHSALGRRPAAIWLNNLLTFSVAPFIGGVLVLVLTGAGQHAPSHELTHGIIFGLIVFGAMLVSVIGLNFVLYALDVRVEDGLSLRRQVRDLFLPLLPGQLAAGMLATILAVAYRSVGLSMLIGAVIVLLIFQYLTVALLRSEERAEQLEARSRQLVGLQLGVLRTLVRALGMREKTTGRHAAAVALYAKALAHEVGCGESELDLIHAAGLLHEIGKFTWPDRILHADVIADEDLAIVRNHPQEGAILVGALDGYGPVADAILYHHERVDGRGYPAGLIGNEIPLASRILAICCTYHTMTAGQGYRAPMAATEAITELRTGSRNGQFDSELVEAFVDLLEREGPTFADDADFETELDFERRVREMAQPKPGEPASPAYGRRKPLNRESLANVRHLGHRVPGKN